MIGTIATAQEGPKLKFDEPDDVFWDNRFGSYGTNGIIWDIEYVNEDTIFVAGDFTVINGVYAPYLAMWDGERWKSIPENNAQSKSFGSISEVKYLFGNLYILNNVNNFAGYNSNQSGEVLVYDFETNTLYPLNPFVTETRVTDIEVNTEGRLYVMYGKYEYSEAAGTNVFKNYVKYHYGPGDYDFTIYNLTVHSPEFFLPKLVGTQKGIGIYNISSGIYNLDESNFITNSADLILFEDFFENNIWQSERTILDTDFQILNASSSDLGIITYTNENGFNSIAEFSELDSTWSFSSAVNYLDPTRVEAFHGTSKNRYAVYGFDNSFNLNLIIKTAEQAPIRSVTLKSSDRITDIELKNNDIYLGGNFDSYSFRWLTDKNISDLAIIDISEQYLSSKPIKPDTSLLGVNGIVFSIEEIDSTIYIGGRFEFAGNQKAYSLAALTGDKWVNIGDVFDEEFEFGYINYSVGQVHIVKDLGDYIAIGGDFEGISYNGVYHQAKNIALYNKTLDRWENLNDGVPFAVFDIEKVGNTIYVVRNNWGNNTIDYYQNGQWYREMKLSEDATLQFEFIDDIYAQGNSLFISGFTNVNSSSFNSEISFRFSVLDPFGLRPIGVPIDLRAISNVTGLFSEIDGKILLSINNQSLIGEDGSITSSPIFEVVGDTVQTFIPSPSDKAVNLIGSNDRLFAYSTSQSGATGLNNIATWNGLAWEIMGSGIQGDDCFFCGGDIVNDAIITSGGDLAVGGNFYLAGNRPSSAFTFWSGETAPSTPVTISFKNNPVIDYSESLTFQWTNANYSSEFEFELSDQVDFSNLIVGITGISENKVEVRTGFEPSVIYYWRVRAVNVNGASSWSDIGTFEMASPVSAEQNEAVVQFELMQNYPNPFNPSTSIQFSIPTSQPVTLEVFDVSGRKIATLLDGEYLPAGIHTKVFNADRLASGVYFYRIAADNRVLLKKMLLIK